jgi:hypothetical protein
MRLSPRIAVALFTLIAAACGGTVDDQQAAANDTTPAAVNLLITRVGQPNLEVQQQTLPATTPPAGDFGPIDSTFAKDFSVLATATDNESGIRDIRLLMTRTVCFMSSGGNVVQAYSGTVTRKTANYADPRNAPKQASLGDTGIMDSSKDTLGVFKNLVEANLLTYKNSNQILRMGVGARTRWNMEARNHAGQTTYSNSIVITAGDVSCVTQP